MKTNRKSFSRALRAVVVIFLLATLLTASPFAGDSVSASTNSSVNGRISQDGFIFENDDANGSGFDANTAQGAGNTSIAGVKRGERLNLRMQVRNTGTAMDNEAALFYDRNDGVYTKVRSSAPRVAGTGSCTSTLWNCTALKTGLGTIGSTSTAVDP